MDKVDEMEYTPVIDTGIVGESVLDKADGNEQLPIERKWTGSYEDTFVPLTAEEAPRVKAEIEQLIFEKMSRYFVAMEAGKSYIFEEKYIRDRRGKGKKGYTQQFELIPTSNPKEIADFYANKPMWIPNIMRNAKGEAYVEWEEVNFVWHWFKKMDRPSYKEIVFEPYSWKEKPYEDEIYEEEGIRIYNRFKGFAVEPDFDNIRGCEAIKHHLLNIICGGDTIRYMWLVSWMAHKVQYPYEKLGTTVVLRGDEGVGKGTVITNVLGKIIGRESFVHVNDVSRVIARFSVLKETSLLCLLDEAIFTRNPEISARLKGLISEQELTHEQKFANAKTIRSYADFAISTNAVFSTPAEATNRRYQTFDIKYTWASVSEKNEYFDHLHREIANGGVQSFFAFLLEWDLEELTHENENGDVVKIDPKRIIKTKSDAEQVEMNQQPHEEWWFECLKNETIGEIYLDNADEYQMSWNLALSLKHIPKEVLFNSVRKYVKKNRPHERAPQKAEFFKFLETTCPSMVAGKKPVIESDSPFYKVTQGGRPICLDLPSLEEARADFEKRGGFRYDWDKGEAIDTVGAGTDAVAELVDAKNAASQTNPKFLTNTSYDDEIPF